MRTSFDVLLLFVQKYSCPYNKKKITRCLEDMNKNICTKILLKLRIYEIHIFELRNEEINVKKILAVINATYAVAKRKREKTRLAGIRTLTSAILLSI